MENIQLENKECTNCKEIKPISEFYMQKTVTKKKGIHYKPKPECKKCTTKRTSEYQNKNIDKARELQKQWRENNKERNNELMKRWHEENKEEFRKYNKQWQQNNKDKMNEHGKRYREEKKFKISSKEWKACKSFFNNCCAYCGMTETESKEIHNKRLNKEHAINKGNNDLSNCVPSCTGCNSSKHANDYNEWFIFNNPVFSEERLLLIETWLNFEYKKHIKIK